MNLHFLKKKIFYIPVAVIVIILLFVYGRGGNKTEPLTFLVEAGNLVQEVTVSGSVKAKEAVDLAFEKGGKIRRINVEVGNRVEQGTLLLATENGVEISAVEDAQAKLESKQAHYNDLKAGGSKEEISVEENGLAKAEADLSSDYSAVANIILDAFNKADNAVHRQADTLFGNPLSANPKLNFNSSDQQASVDAETGRFLVEGVLTNFKKLIQEPALTNTDIEIGLTQAKNYLLSINDFLIKTSRALNAALSLSDSTLSTNKDAINTARTNINTALTNVNDQIQTIRTQKITVETARNEVALIKAPATADVLAGALADVRSAEANVKNAEAVAYKTYIFSPIAGVVTRQDAKIGQIAGANVTLVAVMSDNFKVEAFVPEVDVAKIKVGNPAEITLDAYGSDVNFAGKIVKIDPAETVIDGISTYKTTLEFNEGDPRIRSGMTANITIESAKRENALSVPQRAVYEKGDKKFVRITKSSTITEEREVSTGIRGSNGEIEILTGLEDGERVLTSGK
ncbi:MAG: efflux RND transporter periplasmic adaptor subunit [Patescibacteria group bacterium]